MISTFDKNTHRSRTEISSRDKLFLHQYLHVNFLLRRQYSHFI